MCVLGVCVGGGGSGEKVLGRAGQREVSAKEWEQLFSYMTHCINLIHIINQGLHGYGLHKNSLRYLYKG